jgi:K+-sensing histidine kinase KdpD
VRYDKKNRKIENSRAENEKLRADNLRLNTENKSIQNILEATLHEVRLFSAQVSQFTEQLARKTEGDNGLNDIALSAFYTAGMISARLAYTDIELNPSAILNTRSIRSGIYKKFDKAKKILAPKSKGRKVKVSMTGESRHEIDALPVFELLPFVLLDNAIKYSPDEQEVVVHFELDYGRQNVLVSSVGPIVKPLEKERLFDKGFRGSQTKNIEGQGLGLHLAKQICDWHGIDIKFDIGQNSLYDLNGISYASFKVVLKFK